jgi:hypothetical protein
MLYNRTILQPENALTQAQQAEIQDRQLRKWMYVLIVG